MQTHTPQREFELVERVTTIGSSPDAGLRLDGLERHHAEIRRDDDDNYVYVPLGSPISGSVHGRPGEPAVLRTGTRIEMGAWTVSFYREEYAESSVPLDSAPGRKFARMRAKEQHKQIS
ncbi:MAG: FHA domain-containing protein [Actinomycetota bacterium]|nr:FHA domain-containing protein [Actinomycetota bacterium]